MASRILFVNGINGGFRNTIALTAAKDGQRMASAETAAARAKFMKNMNIRCYRASTEIHYPYTMKMSNTLVDSACDNGIISRKYGDVPPLTYTSVPQVFERIKAIASADMVKKVNACYVFELEGGEGKYYIDFKEGDGQVGEGDVPNKAEGWRPDVKITMNNENMLKMFNRELKPATAFMTGKLKLSGELSKALALETVLKEAREAALK
jgi:putative sterol carrier protein